MENIIGYQLYYLEEGIPMEVKGKMGETSLILKFKLIPLEYKDSAITLIEENGNTVLQESVIKKWFEDNGLEFGQD